MYVLIQTDWTHLAKLRYKHNDDVQVVNMILSQEMVILRSYTVKGSPKWIVHVVFTIWGDLPLECNQLTIVVFVQLTMIIAPGLFTPTQATYSETSSYIACQRDRITKHCTLSKTLNYWTKPTLCW